MSSLQSKKATGAPAGSACKRWPETRWQSRHMISFQFSSVGRFEVQLKLAQVFGCRPAALETVPRCLWRLLPKNCRRRCQRRWSLPVGASAPQWGPAPATKRPAAVKPQKRRSLSFFHHPPPLKLSWKSSHESGHCRWRPARSVASPAGWPIGGRWGWTPINFKRVNKCRWANMATWA